MWEVVSERGFNLFRSALIVCGIGATLVLLRIYFSDFWPPQVVRPPTPYAVEKIRDIRLYGGTSFGAWSPNGKQLVTMSSIRHIALWDAESGQLVREFDVAKRYLATSHVAFFPDGQSIVVAADTGDIVEKKATAVIWDLATGQPKEYVTAAYQNTDPRANIIKAFALSKDGNYLVLQSTNKSTDPIALYANRDWEHPGYLSLNNGLMTAAAFSSDNHYLAVGTIRGWLNIFKLDDKVSFRRCRFMKTTWVASSPSLLVPMAS